MMTPKRKHFTAFRTAGEEDSNTKDRQARAENVGLDHLSATSGRIVQTPGKEKPYKVVLEHEGQDVTEHPVATIEEGEALIKRKTPRPPKRNTLRDRAGP